MAADDFFIPGLVRIALRSTSEGSNRLNIFHFKTTAAGPLSVTDLLQLGSAFWTLVVAPYYKPLVGANINFEDVTVTDRSAPGLNQAVYVPAQPQPGGASGDGLPANAAIVIKNKTGKTGRSHRGRTYLYGITEAQASGSTVNSTYVTAAAVLGQQLIQFLGTTPIPTEYTVASRKFLYMTKIIAVVIDAFVDSQRNRLIGRGN